MIIYTIYYSLVHQTEAAEEKCGANETLCGGGKVERAGGDDACFWVRSGKTWAAAAAAERMTVTSSDEALAPSSSERANRVASSCQPRAQRPVKTRSFRIVIVALPFMVPQLPRAPAGHQLWLLRFALTTTTTTTTNTTFNNNSHYQNKKSI